MATEENIDEKLGDLKIDEPEQKEAVLEELTENPPKLHHVESPETAEEPTEEGGVVKAEVPEAFEEELKGDHDIVPPTEEKPTSTEESVAKEPEPAVGETETPVETKPPSKISAFGNKISATLHKIVGKD